MLCSVDLCVVFSGPLCCIQVFVLNQQGTYLLVTLTCLHGDLVVRTGEDSGMCAGSHDLIMNYPSLVPCTCI